MAQIISAAPVNIALGGTVYAQATNVPPTMLVRSSGVAIGLSGSVQTITPPPPVTVTRSTEASISINGSVSVSIPAATEQAVLQIAIAGIARTSQPIHNPIPLHITLNGFATTTHSISDAESAATMRLAVAGQVAVGSRPDEWLWGSRIGELDFTLDEENAAFRRPVHARGEILQLCHLGRKVIIFTAHGADGMEPDGLYWKYEHLTDVGPLSQWAICDVPGVGVFFVDEKHRLVHIQDQGFSLIDCRKWLYEDNYVLAWDYQYSLLYISSASSGWAWNPEAQSFGKGIAAVTGSVPQGRVASPEPLAPGLFNICTNMYDFNSRSMKTITAVEFSMRTNTWLEAAIDYRVGNEDSWRTTPWRRVTESGTAHIHCYGVEFRFRLRSRTPQAVHLDQIRVVGSIHGYDFLNAIGWSPNAGGGF